MADSLLYSHVALPAFIVLYAICIRRGFLYGVRQLHDVTAFIVFEDKETFSFLAGNCSGSFCGMGKGDRMGIDNSGGDRNRYLCYLEKIRNACFMCAAFGGKSSCGK